MLTPRQLWHECEDHDHEMHHSTNEQSIEQDDCYACDFDLGVISQASFFHLIFEKRLYVKYIPFSFSFPNKEDFHQFTNRGPPTV